MELYITSYTHIRSKKILRDGVIVFESAATGNEFLRKAYEEGLQINYPKFYKMDALGKLGILAAEVLLKNIEIKKYNPTEVGIILSNQNASIEADINYFETAHSFPSPALFVYTLPNIVIGELSIRYKFKGENAFFISDAFDADWLCFYVNELMQHRKTNACICGWIEATDGNFDVCFYFIEKNEAKKELTFTTENLNRIYNFTGSSLPSSSKE